MLRCLPLLGLLGLLACSDSSTCDDLVGVTFARGPDLPCMVEGEGSGDACPVWIRFDGEQFTWNQVSTSVSGTYTCSGGSLTGEQGTSTFEGDFDAGNEVLTWDGLTYGPVE